MGIRPVTAGEPKRAGTQVIEAVGRNGADGVVIHKGRVRFLDSLGPRLAAGSRCRSCSVAGEPPG
jgi:hypothetical protein